MAHAHHDHSGSGSSLTSQQTQRLLLAVVGLVALAAMVGMFVLRPDGDRPTLAEELGLGAEIVDATVTDVVDVPCRGTVEADGVLCYEVQFRVTSGTPSGDDASFEIPITETAVELGAGDRITLGYQATNDPGLEYYFNDFQRRTPLLVLGAIFAVAVIALGRFQGVRALIGLGITGVVILGFLFPSILDGHDPTAAALVAAAVIALIALYLTHGVTEMITVALLGTFAALALTAVLAAVFASLAHFTGFASEDAFYLAVVSAQVDVEGLVLAGIIIGSLGVLDDVTVTQVSAVWQLHEANPSYGARRLYASAVKIGRDHIASTVNTLVLAYAGASLPLLLVFTQAGRSLGDVVVGELVAVEIVRTLVGSIGLVAAVPITTGLAAYVVTRGSTLRPPEPSGGAAPDAGPSPYAPGAEASMLGGPGVAGEGGAGRAAPAGSGGTGSGGAGAAASAPARDAGPGSGEEATTGSGGAGTGRPRRRRAGSGGGIPDRAGPRETAADGPQGTAEPPARRPPSATPEGASEGPPSAEDPDPPEPTWDQFAPDPEPRDW